MIEVYYCIDHKFLDLTLESIDYVQRVSTNNINFNIISPDRDAIFQEIGNRHVVYDVPDTYKHLSVPQLRVIGPELIPGKRLIYLDSDTVTTKCLSKLWNVDLEGYVLGGCQHACILSGGDATAFYGFDIGYLKYCERYLNTGVLLFDCDMWRKQAMTQKCLDSFREYDEHRQKFNDEPGINAALNDQWFALDPCWNHFPDKDYTRAGIIHYYGQSIYHKPRHTLF